MLQLKAVSGYGNYKVLETDANGNLIWNPRLLGGNGNRVYTKYLSDFATIALAVAAINTAGTPKARLVLDEPFTNDVTGDIPVNISFEVEGGGFLTQINNTTLTIRKFKDPGDVRVFNVEGYIVGGVTTPGGNVVFANDAINIFRVSWYVETLTVTDATRGMANIYTSLTNNGGGTCFVKGKHLLTATQPFALNSIYLGESKTNSGFVLSGANLSVFELGTLGANDNQRNVKVVNMTLDANSQSNSRCVLMKGQGGDPATGGTLAAFNVHFHDVRFQNATLANAEVFSTGASWEMENLAFTDCNSLNAPKHFACNTENTSIHFVRQNFVLSPNQTGWHITQCGAFNSIGHLAVGTVYAGTGIGSTLWKSDGGHGPVMIEKGQDEGLDYFADQVTTGGYANPFPEGSFILKGNLIQSKIMFRLDSHRTVNSEGNSYPSGAFVDEATVTVSGTVHSSNGRVFSRFDRIDSAYSIGGFVPPAGGQIDNFVGDSEVLERQHIAPQLGRTTKVYTKVECSNLVYSTAAQDQLGAAYGQLDALPNELQAIWSFQSRGLQPFYRRGTMNAGRFYGEILYRDSAGDICSVNNQAGAARRFLSPIRIGAAGSAISKKLFGTATLVSGTVVVSNVAVAAGSKIWLSVALVGGTPAVQYDYVINSGVGFTIRAKNAANANETADTSTINWMLME